MASQDESLDRRSFLSALSAVGGWLTARRWPHAAGLAPRVEAVSTAFYAHPDGTLNLVRFSVDAVDAPAGRLRVYDGERRLLGTAGVLRRDATLYGELWIPLGRARQIVSELEAPGLRGPLRTAHQLIPHRKWVIHLFSAVHPARAADELQDLPSFRRAAHTALYRTRGVRIDPVPPKRSWDMTDHVPFLETIARRIVRARLLGIPPGTVGATDSITGLSSAHVRALAGAGVRAVAVSDGEASFRWLESADGSRLLLVPLQPRATPADLGFLEGLDAMTSRLERWLATHADQPLAPSDQGTAVLVSSDLGAAAGAIHRTVSDWNQRFAFPTIISNDAVALWQDAAQQRGTMIPVVTPAPAVSVDLPTRSEIEAAVAARRQRDVLRSEGIFGLLAGVLPTDSEGLGRIVSRIPALVPGTAVFNQSPFSRSEFVRLADGSERVVTDIPGLGYAYFPDQPSAEQSQWEDLTARHEIQGRSLRVRLNTASGAVESLVSLTDGTEWVREGSPGLNAFAPSTLQDLSASRLSGTATRLTAVRWSPARGTLRTTLTLYDRIPWLDIHNEGETTGDDPVSVDFHFAIPQPRVTWEVPGGIESSEPPVSRLDHLRWLRIGNGRDSILIAGIDAPPATVSSDGTVVSYGARGPLRYRVGLHSDYDSPDIPWQFGWGTTPMLTAHVEPGNAGELPTFGAVLDVERVGVVVLGIAKSAGPDAAVLYMQELHGIQRDVAVRAGLVRFRWAQQVDLLGREIGSPLEPQNGTVVVPVSGRGVVALQLHGLELNRA